MRRAKRFGNPGDPGTVVRGPGKTRTRSRPSAELTPGAKKRRPAGDPGHRLEQCVTPADGALGSETGLRVRGPRVRQVPAPGCTERPRAVQERPPGRGNERPGDPGPRERIPPRRPASRVPNSPQDHQLPVFHRLLVGGAGFLLAGGKHGAALGRRRCRLRRDPRRVRAAATLPSRERGERAGERHGGERGAGRPVPRLLRRGCARRPPAPPELPSCWPLRAGPSRDCERRREPRGRRSARRRGAERARQVGRPRRRPRLRAPAAPARQPPRPASAPCYVNIE